MIIFFNCLINDIGSASAAPKRKTKPQPIPERMPVIRLFTKRFPTAKWTFKFSHTCKKKTRENVPTIVRINACFPKINKEISNKGKFMISEVMEGAKPNK